MTRDLETSYPFTLNLKVGFALALMMLHTPVVHAQAECEDVSGAWAVELTLPGSGSNTVTLTVEQSECSVEGLIEGHNRTPIEGGIVEGSTVTFTAMAANQGDGSSIAIVWEATVDGDSIGGTLNSSMMGVVEFSGKRIEG